MESYVSVLICCTVCLHSAFSFSHSISDIKYRQNSQKQLSIRMTAATIQQQKPLKNPFNFITKIFKRKERTRQELSDGIAKFYDESSGIWLDTWGEHMHHGFYEPMEKSHDHQQAQIDMIDKAIDWSYGSELNKVNPKSTIDVGCGVGGSSRHIMKRFNMGKGDGISLSHYQISRATEFTASSDNANLSSKLKYQVADALNMPFPDNKYDLTWSMESGEHMPDKAKFMKELVRVTAPNGRVILVTWCHRELAKTESLKDWEVKLLQKISDAYYLPAWVPVSTYVKLATQLGLTDVRHDDWSRFVAPFWPAVFFSALRPLNFIRMLRAGWTVIKGAIATLWMLRGFQKGLVKFVIVTGHKPASSTSTSLTSLSSLTSSTTATAPSTNNSVSSSSATASTSTTTVAAPSSISLPSPPLDPEFWGTEE